MTAIGAERARTAAKGPDTDWVAPGLELVTARPLVETGVVVRIELAAGDRPLVSVGERVAVGAPLAERVRDARLEEVSALGPQDGRRPGDRWTGELRRGGRATRAAEPSVAGELLFENNGRWRLATGDHLDVVGHRRRAASRPSARASR